MVSVRVPVLCWFDKSPRAAEAGEVEIEEDEPEITEED